MIWSQLSHIQRMKLQIELVIQFLRFAMVVSYMTNLFCLHSAHMSHIYIYICGRLFRFAKIKIWEQCEEAKKCGFPPTKCECSHLGFCNKNIRVFFYLRARNSVYVVRSARVSEFAFSYKKICCIHLVSG